MPKRGHQSKSKATAGDGSRHGRRGGARANAHGNRTSRRADSVDEMNSAPPYIDAFHYKPGLEITDYHLFQKLRFYVLPDHSLRDRPELGYVRVYDMVHGTEPLLHPVELSCGVFAFMEQPPDEQGNNYQYPDNYMVRSALEAGQFLRCIDFRQYLQTMWEAEEAFWDTQKVNVRAARCNPIQAALEEMFTSVFDPLRGLDLGELCERLALMARSYSEDAGLRHTLIIAPQLPIPASQSLYHKLRGVLERAFDLFLVGSEIRELPPTPDPDESTTSEEDEWTDSTQLRLSSSAEDVISRSSSRSESHKHDCPVESCDGGSVDGDLGPNQPSQSSDRLSPQSDPWDELLPLAAEEDDPALSMLLVRSLVTPETTGSPEKRRARRQRIRNALECGTAALSQVLFGKDGPEGEIPDSGRCKNGKGKSGDAKLAKMGRRGRMAKGSSLEVRKDGGELSVADLTVADDKTMTERTADCERPSNDTKSDGSHEAKGQTKRKSSVTQAKKKTGSSSSSTDIAQSSTDQPISVDQVAADPVLLKDDMKPANQPDRSQGQKLHEQMLTLHLDSPSDDNEDHDDDVSHWNFLQNYTDRVILQAPRDPNCTLPTDVLEGVATNSGMKAIYHKTGGPETHNAARGSNDNNTNANGNSKSENVKDTKQENDAEKTEAKAGTSAKRKSRNKRKKKSKQNEATAEADRDPSSKEVNDNARLTAKKTSQSRSLLKKPLSTHAQKHRTVFGFGAMSKNEMVRIYVPGEEIGKVGVDVLKKLDEETHQTVAGLKPKQKVCKQDTEQNAKATSKQSRPPPPFPYQAIGCADGSMPGRLRMAASQEAAPVLDETASLENLVAKTVPQTSRTQTENGTKNDCSSKSTCKAPSDASEPHSPAQVGMSRVSPTADSEETVGILKAALKSSDHSVRITAHSLLVAIDEDVDPLELATPEKSAPKITSARAGGNGRLPASPDSVPQLCPKTTSQDVVTKSLASTNGEKLKTNGKMSSDRTVEDSKGVYKDSPEKVIFEPEGAVRFTKKSARSVAKASHSLLDETSDKGQQKRTTEKRTKLPPPKGL